MSHSYAIRPSGVATTPPDPRIPSSSGSRSGLSAIASSVVKSVRGVEKGPDARRRPKAPGEAYNCLSPRLVAPPLSSNRHEPAAKGAPTVLLLNGADGPLS